jgi:hypothetical protein
MMQQEPEFNDTATSLLATLRNKGVNVTLGDDHMIHISPGHKLTDVEAEEIRTHRDELIVLLSGQYQAKAGAQIEPSVEPSEVTPEVAAAAEGEVWTEPAPEGGSGNNADAIAGAVIRLGVVSEQLRLLAKAIETARAKIYPRCEKHQTVVRAIEAHGQCSKVAHGVTLQVGTRLQRIDDQLSALGGALQLTRTLVDSLLCDLYLTR